MLTQKEFYKKIVNALPEGVVICNPDNEIVDVNKKFETISGFSREELLGREVFEIIKVSCKEACIVCEDEENTEDASNLGYQLGELKDKSEQLICIRISQAKTENNDGIIYLLIPFSDIAFFP